MKSIILLIGLMSNSLFANVGTLDVSHISTFKEMRTIMQVAVRRSLDEKIKQGYRIEKVFNVSSGKDIFILVKS